MISSCPDNDIFIAEDVLFKRPSLISLGRHIAIDKGFYITTAMTLGDYVHIGPYATCIGGEEGKFIAHGFNNIMAGARLICCSDRFDDSGLFGALIPKKYKGTQINSPIIMEAFSNVGTNAIVMPGSTLRKGVLLCAGALLIGDTEEWGVYKGNPARLVNQIDGSKAIAFAKEMGYGF